MTLTGAQIAQLRDALLAAYPRRDDLRMMARVELGENLDAIAGGDTLRAVAFSLIEWAQRTGRVEELIAGARRGNPGNPMGWDDLRAKFMPLVEPKLGEATAAELFACLRDFERPGALADLWRLCAAHR